MTAVTLQGLTKLRDEENSEDVNATLETLQQSGTHILYKVIITTSLFPSSRGWMELLLVDCQTLKKWITTNTDDARSINV